MTDASALLKQAIVEMRQMRSQIESLEAAQSEDASEPIAIIGMACRFPQGPDLAAYWELLHQGKCAVRDIPIDRWDVDRFYDGTIVTPGKIYTRQGCFIEQPDQFDAGFFNISPREASAMDPQQRLLLETSYRAIEQAGIPVESLRGSKTGVYVGLCFDDYGRSTLSKDHPASINAFSSLGNTRSIAAGRIAYTFGLQGTTMQLDTTCSSSLLAVHLAAQALRNGELDMALVGGVNLMLAPEVMIGFCQLKALAVDGRSKAFDAKADGYGRGEGCGMVLLKRLSEAAAAGDRILAVLRGSAVNHDGASNGLTAPNGKAQAEVIQMALTNAKVAANQVQYVETHGTGTILGDPIEVLALEQAYGEERSKALRIGSVKASIGHLEGAAGIASLIKVVLAMQQETFPPQPNYQTPNPHIPWSDLAIQVNAQAESWRGEKLAGISSFGMSGTNVHMILAGGGEPAIESKMAPNLHLLCLSAKHPAALKDLITAHLNHLVTNADLDAETFARFCQASLTQKSHFYHRFACGITDRTTAIAQLQQALISLPQDSPQDLREIPADLANFQSHSATPESMERLCTAYCQHHEIDGKSIDWAMVLPAPLPRVALPEYPFQKQRYWCDRLDSTGSHPPIAGHPLLGQALKLAHLTVHYFEQHIHLDRLPYLADHQVAGRSILPTSAFLELFWAGLAEVGGGQIYDLEHFVIHHPMVLAKTRKQVQTLCRSEGDRWHCEILSYDGIQERWITHATALAVLSNPVVASVDLIALENRAANYLDIPSYYQQFQRAGLVYGEAFQSLKKVRQGDRWAIGKVTADSLEDFTDYIIHPILLDGCLQTIGAALPLGQQRQGGYVPVGCDRVLKSDQILPKSVWSIVEIIEVSDRTAKVNVQMLDETGRLLVELQGLQLQALAPAETDEWQDWLYDVAWEAIEAPQTAENDSIVQTAVISNGDINIFVEAGLISDPTAAFRLGNPEARSLENLNPSRIIYDATQPTQEITATATGLLEWVQTIIQSNTTCRELVILTQSAFDLHQGDPTVNIASAGLWGLAKTLRLEQPQWSIRCFDLDGNVTDQRIAALIQGLNLDEPDLAIRLAPTQPARFYSPQLRSHSLQSATPYQLTIAQPGDLEQLQTKALPRLLPSPSEVEIRVLATGVNFRDVLNALDLYPGIAGELGCESVGEIVQLGVAVTGFNLGDRVIALAQGSYSQYVTVDARCLALAPTEISPTQAASLGVAFLTAHYSLCHLAQIKCGDRVLIHAAAGAVGQAAVQIAQSCGAEVYATASPGKWARLRGLGINHTFNSRDEQFGEGLLAASNQQPMDIVLNCLSGAFIPNSLALLKPTGHFLELGKIGILSAEAVAQIKPDVKYHPIDLIDLCQSDPDLIQTLLNRSLQHFQHHQPIAHRSFPLAHTKQAFRLMQQGRHDGKLVIVANPPAIQIRSDRTYLITGGTGGLGLAVAQLLVKEGATDLTLLSRNPPSPIAQAKIQQLAAQGVTLTLAQIDGRDAESIAQCLQSLTKPLGGIIHAAGILDDALIPQQTPTQFAAVINTKVETAWHLHQLTQHQSLDFFLLFSSATAIFGSPGQANHVIANAGLDALAQYRRQKGLPALSINWGIWSDIGSAAGPAVTSSMAARGIKAMAPDRCLKSLRALLLAPPNSPTIAIMDIDRSTLSQQRNWGRLLQPPSNLETAPRSTILNLICNSDQSKAINHLENYLKERLSKILGFQTDDLDINTGFFDLGMDSLTAVELSSRLKEDLQCEISATASFDYPTIGKLASHLVEQIQAEQVQGKTHTIPPQDLEDLSTSDIATLLAQELLSIQQEKTR